MQDANLGNEEMRHVRQLEKNKGELRRLISELGFAEVNSADELGLTEAEKGKLFFIPDVTDPEAIFFKAARTDGTEAKAIVKARSDRYVFAEVFSPGLTDSHGGNHDFDWIELSSILKRAIEGPARKE
jgi:hypothetical protein